LARCGREIERIGLTDLCAADGTWQTANVG